MKKCNDERVPFCTIALDHEHPHPNPNHVYIRSFRVTEPLCTCVEIMTADPTRHFKGCPLREKYPSAAPSATVPCPVCKSGLPFYVDAKTGKCVRCAGAGVVDACFEKAKVPLEERIAKLEENSEAADALLRNRIEKLETADKSNLNIFERQNIRLNTLEKKFDERVRETSDWGRRPGDPNTFVDALHESQKRVTALLNGSRIIDGVPRIVCLCGSTRFAKAFADANLEETLKGNIVLTVGSMTHSDADIKACVYCGALDGSNPCDSIHGRREHEFHPLTSKHHIGTKGKLDALHKRKIEMADEVLVLNVKACAYCKTPYAGVVDGCPEAPPRPGSRPPFHNDCKFEPYIGESTRSEIEHALTLQKPIRFLNPQGRSACTKLDGGDQGPVGETMHLLGLLFQGKPGGV